MFEQAGLLFENNQGVARSLVFDSLFRSRASRLDGARQGVAISARQDQGAQGAVGAFVPLHNRFHSTHPTASPSASCSAVVPEQATRQHLRVLSELAQMPDDPSWREETLDRHRMRARFISTSRPGTSCADQRRAAV